MPKSNYLITTFESGEVSRKVEGRVGSPLYQSACRTALNVFVLPHGSVEGRPGSIFVGTTKNTAEKCRLFPFERANGNSYVIEMTRSNARFYTNDARLTGGTTDIAIPTALTDAQLFDLHYQQIDDVIYFCTTRNVARMFAITYTSDTSWAAAVVSITGTITYNTSAPNAPSILAIHEQRLVLGGDSATPTRVLGSVVNDYENFGPGASPTASDSWDYRVPGTGGLWLLAWTGLLFGAVKGEWSFGTDIITPTTLPNLKRQSEYGSSRVQPVLDQNVGVFVQAGGRRLRQIIFSNDLQAYVATDLTQFSEDITGTGIVDMALQNNPSNVLWCVRNDGQIALLNGTETGQKAWSRVVTRSGDTIESVAVIRNGAEDQVWISVQRSINGSNTRHIEYFNARDFGDDQEDAIYLDAALTFDGGAAVNVSALTQADPAVVTTSANHGLSTDQWVRLESIGGMTEINTLHDGVFRITVLTGTTFSLQDPEDVTDIDSTGFTAYTSGGTEQRVAQTITGLSHLEAEVCGVLANGGVHPDRTPDASGEIVLQEYHNTVHVGLRYNQDVEPVPIEPLEAVGRTANLARIRLKVLDTLGLSVGPDSSNLTAIIFRDVDDPLSTPPPLFTGVKKTTIKGAYKCPATLFIRQPDPLPMTLLGIQADVEINDVV